MPAAKNDKAVINNRTYTIIGHESSQHMEMVTKLVKRSAKRNQRSVCLYQYGRSGDSLPSMPLAIN